MPGNKIGDLEIAIVEKGSFVGAHILSGAVMDPIAIRELMPDFLAAGLSGRYGRDRGRVLVSDGKARRSMLRSFRRRSRTKASTSSRLSKICEWLGEKCEEAGINIFPGVSRQPKFSTTRTTRVIGVRTGDKGIDKEGKPKANFEPGVDLLAKVTVLGEGSRGSLAKQLMSRLGLMEGKEPQVFSLGVKELWEVPDGEFSRGQGRSHARLSVRHRDVRRRMDLRDEEQRRQHRLCDRPRLRRSDDRPAPRVSEIQDASEGRRDSQGRQDDQIRREVDQHRRLLDDADSFMPTACCSSAIRHRS